MTLGHRIQLKPQTPFELGRGKPIENSPFLALSMSYLGWDYLEQGDVVQAEALSELAMQAMRRKPNGNPRANLEIMTQHGAVQLAQRRFAEAEPLLRQGYEGLVPRQASLPPYLNAPRRVTESLERLVQL